MNISDVYLFHNAVVKFELLNLYLGKDLETIKVAHTTINKKIGNKVSYDISPKVVNDTLKQEMMKKCNHPFQNTIVAGDTNPNIANEEKLKLMKVRS